MLKNKKQIVVLISLVAFLVAIRAFENYLFYDPFLVYFKSDYQNLLLPKVTNFQLFFGLFLRYFLNSIISLSILYVIFKELSIVSFASILYVLLFVILIIAFFFTLFYFGENHKMALFYIRRFLIQPIFVMLFIPAFYYQKKGFKN